MVSPLSLVLIIYFREKKGLESPVLKSRILLRYVDNTFVIWPHPFIATKKVIRDRNVLHKYDVHYTKIKN